MAIKISTPLNYDYDSLEPHFSEESIRVHYENHYGRYVDNLTKLLQGTPFKTIDEVLGIQDHDEQRLISDPMYNNAAQIRNHDLFFEQLNIDRSDLTDEDLTEMVDRQYESVHGLIGQLDVAVSKFFGSGWVWLVIEQRKDWDAPHLAILTTPNGGTFTNFEDDNHIVIPLLIIDVWEHAFYIDHQSDKSKYMENFWPVLDWSVVETRFKKAMKQVVDYTKPFEL